MGQKVHPYGFRLGVTEDWESKWFASPQEIRGFVKEDYLIRKYIKERLKSAGIAKVQIERTPNHVVVIIHTARPGIVIGRRGVLIDKLRKELAIAINRADIEIRIQEIKNPELNATLVAENIARRIEQRVHYRRAMKQAVSTSMKLGALGVKVACKGRLRGAEIARQEWYREGKVPLHTIRADIDYACIAAKTRSGTIGVKVWIYKGEKIS